MTLQTLVALFLLLLALPAHADVTGPADVVDGDTIHINKTKFRLHGTDERREGIGMFALSDFFALLAGASNRPYGRAGSPLAMLSSPTSTKRWWRTVGCWPIVNTARIT